VLTRAGRTVDVLGTVSLALDAADVDVGEVRARLAFAPKLASSSSPSSSFRPGVATHSSCHLAAAAGDETAFDLTLRPANEKVLPVCHYRCRPLAKLTGISVERFSINPMRLQRVAGRGARRGHAEDARRRPALLRVGAAALQPAARALPFRPARGPRGSAQRHSGSSSLSTRNSHNQFHALHVVQCRRAG